SSFGTWRRQFSVWWPAAASRVWSRIDAPRKPLLPPGNSCNRRFLSEEEVASGEWRVASGEWRVASGERTVALVRAGSPDPPVLCNRRSPCPRPLARHPETCPRQFQGLFFCFFVGMPAAYFGNKNCDHLDTTQRAESAAAQAHFTFGDCVPLR